LPAHSGEPGGEAAIDRAGEPDLARWTTSGTALVVDDEAGVRDLVRTVLQRMGLTVVVAEDGRTGVETFRHIADDVRLALIDLTMPGLDGREALDAMRAIKPGLPVILMSGFAAEEVGDRTAHGFLQKPFTPVSLRRAVWLALGGKSAG
jgi:CheY-like chemotaxis protein